MCACVSARVRPSVCLFAFTVMAPLARGLATASRSCVLPCRRLDGCTRARGKTFGKIDLGSARRTWLVAQRTHLAASFDAHCLATLRGVLMSVSLSSSASLWKICNKIFGDQHSSAAATPLQIAGLREMQRSDTNLSNILRNRVHAFGSPTIQKKPYVT